MQFVKYLSASFLFLSLLSCGNESVSLSWLQPGSTVLAFGDSLTAGYGANPQQSYPSVLAQLAVLKVINAGVSGELSAAGLNRLPALLDQHTPLLVILCHGGNDLLRSTGSGAAKSNILAMIELIRERGSDVLLVGVPRPGIFLSTAEFYHEIADETGVAYMPDLIENVLSDTALKSDAVHPNAAGYQLIASEIHNYLRNAGAL
ncbi:MAG: arylesterase [Proteobacteria bacterium]|nr:arylesterase [Pseudomonadota bacterium]